MSHAHGRTRHAGRVSRRALFITPHACQRANTRAGRQKVRVSEPCARPNPARGRGEPPRTFHLRRTRVCMQTRARDGKRCARRASRAPLAWGRSWHSGIKRKSARERGAAELRRACSRATFDPSHSLWHGRGGTKRAATTRGEPPRTFHYAARVSACKHARGAAKGARVVPVKHLHAAPPLAQRRSRHSGHKRTLGAGARRNRRSDGVLPHSLLMLHTRCGMAEAESGQPPRGRAAAAHFLVRRARVSVQTRARGGKRCAPYALTLTADASRDRFPHSF